MPGPGFRQKKLTLSVSLVTYKQIQKLAEQRDLLVSDYVRKLVIQHLVDLGLPIYYDQNMEKEEDEQAKDDGQEQ